MVVSAIPETQTQASTWQWQNWNGLPYLTCSLLQDWQHGFFTQQFYPNGPETLAKILNPDAKVYRVKQVHGNRVLTAGEIEQEIRQQKLEAPENRFPPADGILSDRLQQAIWVASADCTPVLIGDGQTGMVSAIHAGWRGTAQRIVPEAIARFVEYGSALENLRIALGPAIAGVVYQVSEQVGAEVGASLISKELADPPDAILAALKSLPDPPILDDPHPGRVRLDVRRVNYLQLIELGIRPEQIAIAPQCTYQHPEYFFSYRRTKAKKVQWSGIVSNTNSLKSGNR
ncbi:laccase [Hydrococcus rivularis NIES-593]|uniref:Purine nucleoside phosphorylase n=1 Tax=Hydrococcus rivularis NIES-593 TaxID=1921803 RepID=A0A1U7HFZ5_9CYAN|nr:laccase [Hydrococcus rivularis NIES-593]